MIGQTLCSVHTHSDLCDGKNTIAEMAAAAYAAGVRHFGVSGHSHTPIPSDEWNVLPFDLTIYREQALSLRRAYDGRMDVLLGIEQDSCSMQEVPTWCDYWIGSVHDLCDPKTGLYYPVDWREEDLARCCVEMFHGDFPALISRYYTDVAAMAARKPTILGHIDLITKLNGGGDLFDEENRYYRMAAMDALHAVDPDRTLLEINTGAMARGYRKAPYPAVFLLEEWKRMGGRVILTADAHSADAVVFGYQQAADAARAAGFAETVLLTQNGQITLPI